MSKGILYHGFRNLVAATLLTVFASGTATAMRNPSAVYCNEMGYDFEIEHTSKGEKGVCIADGKKFDAWDFFNGKVGKEYSFCVKQGYDIETSKEGNAYSQECAICVEKGLEKKGLEKKALTMGIKKRIPMIKLMGLSEKLDKHTYIAPEKSIKTFKSPAQTLKRKPLSAKPKSTASNLPSSFDWRDDNGNWMTPVKMQGYSCGACTDFTALGAVEAKLKIDSYDLNYNPDLSEQQLISCDKVVDCNTGGEVETNLSVAMNNGIVDEDCLPYTGENSECNLCADSEDRRTFIKSWDSIYQEGWGSLNHIQQEEITKQAIIEKGPLTAYISMVGEFDENNIYKCDVPGSLNHSVVLMGYKDTGDIHTSYWIAKNSWGNNWEDNGYFKIGWDGFYSGWGIYSQCGVLFHPPSFIKTKIASQDTDIGKAINSLQILLKINSGNVRDLDISGNGKVGLEDAVIYLQRASELRQ